MKVTSLMQGLKPTDNYDQHVDRFDITVQQPSITMELYAYGLPKRAGVYMFRETINQPYRPREVTAALPFNCWLAIDEERWGGELIFVKHTQPDQWLHIHA